MLRDNDYLAIAPEWVLRKEAHMAILYLMSTTECRFLQLDPVSAIVLALLDGQCTVAELAQTVNYVFSMPTLDASRALLDNVVASVNAGGEKIRATAEPANNPVHCNPLDFVISSQDYAPHHRLSKPLSLLIYFSSRCQTNCRYCYADLTHMRRLKHLPLAKWRLILNDAKSLDIRLIQLTGGDPLGRPDSIDFIEQLVSNQFLFMLSTKCFVSQRDAMRLADAGFSEPVNGVPRDFQVSVDTPDPRVAAHLVGRADYVERAKQTVCNLQQAGIPVRIKAVVTPFNCSQAADLVEVFARLGVRDFQFTSYGRSYYRHDDELFLPERMKETVASLLLSAASKHPEIRVWGDMAQATPGFGDEKLATQTRWQQRASCSAGRTNLGIAPDGRAVLCEQMPLADPYFVGDLTKQSIMEVWNSPALNAFVTPSRTEFRGTPCFECADYDNCIQDMGYCFRDSLFIYGRIHHPPPDCPKAPKTSFRRG